MSLPIFLLSRQLAAGLALVAALLAAPTALTAQGGRVVDLELALLVDVSASVSPAEYRLQARGFAAALQSDVVRDALANTRDGVAIAVIQWADEPDQRISIDWTLVDSAASADALSFQLASMPRLIHGGHTAIGSALAVALAELEGNAFVGRRRVIDVSGDGRSNGGHPLRTARAAVLERGAVINALAILNELPLLERYFRDHLIGGEGAFVMTADDYPDFAAAMAKKLAREITDSQEIVEAPSAARRYAAASALAPRTEE